MSLEKEIVVWHVVTFPRASFRACMNKLCEEFDEFVDAVESGMGKSAICEEAADVRIVLEAILGRFFGTTTTEEARKKMKINIKREWGQENELGDRPRSR